MTESDYDSLTPREIEVLDKLLEVYTTTAIADQLGISVKTVDLHFQHIYKKLRVDWRVELALKWAHWRWSQK